MVATLMYWGITLALIGWGLWSCFFSIIYVHNHENGNLWFFAIINAILLVLGIIFWWFFNHPAWQKYWLDQTTKTYHIVGIVLIAYAVMIILQWLLGRTPKAQKA